MVTWSGSRSEDLLGVGALCGKHVVRWVGWGVCRPGVSVRLAGVSGAQGQGGMSPLGWVGTVGRLELLRVVGWGWGRLGKEVDG